MEELSVLFSPKATSFPTGVSEVGRSRAISSWRLHSSSADGRRVTWKGLDGRRVGVLRSVQPHLTETRLSATHLLVTRQMVS